jgi:hypothetical protein
MEVATHNVMVNRLEYAAISKLELFAAWACETVDLCVGIEWEGWEEAKDALDDWIVSKVLAIVALNDW